MRPNILKRGRKRCSTNEDAGDRKRKAEGEADSLLKPLVNPEVQQKPAIAPEALEINVEKPLVYPEDHVKPNFEATLLSANIAEPIVAYSAEELMMKLGQNYELDPWMEPLVYPEDKVKLHFDDEPLMKASIVPAEPNIVDDNVEESVISLAKDYEFDTCIEPLVYLVTDFQMSDSTKTKTPEELYKELEPFITFPSAIPPHGLGTSKFTLKGVERRDSEVTQKKPLQKNATRKQPSGSDDTDIQMSDSTKTKTSEELYKELEPFIRFPSAIQPRGMSTKKFTLNGLGRRVTETEDEQKPLQKIAPKKEQIKVEASGIEDGTVLQISQVQMSTKNKTPEQIYHEIQNIMKSIPPSGLSSTGRKNKFTLKGLGRVVVTKDEIKQHK